MKKISKHLIALAIISLLVSPIFVLPALAQTETNETFGINIVQEGLNNSLPGQGTDPRTIAGRIINFALGFLGLIAVSLI
jgi:hypothetical protein